MLQLSWVFSSFVLFFFKVVFFELPDISGLAVVFQSYPYASAFNLLQFCPFMALVDFPVFGLSCSVDLSCYFDIRLIQ